MVDFFDTKLRAENKDFFSIHEFFAAHGCLIQCNVISVLIFLQCSHDHSIIGIEAEHKFLLCRCSIVP